MRRWRRSDGMTENCHPEQKWGYVVPEPLRWCDPGEDRWMCPGWFFGTVGVSSAFF
ncbi:MAG TPA: hypothetical protein VKB45_16735 [Gemmatimonadales bacterium]|nr:hypothetical protein [Gemmatimonadales bacterium]